MTGPIAPVSGILAAAFSVALSPASAMDGDVAFPRWAGFGNFERFGDATYWTTNVFLEGRIRDRIDTEYGLPDVLASETLTTDGITLVVHADIEDVERSYESDGQETPSVDDAYGGAIAAVVLYDAKGFGYIIGAGVIPPDALAGADRGDIGQYIFYAADFMANADGGPDYVVPTAGISRERRAEAGIVENGALTLGTNDTLTISVVSGPPGHFVQVADERVTMFMGRLEGP